MEITELLVPRLDLLDIIVLFVGRLGAQRLVGKIEEAVADAHKRGLKVWVYTINEPEVANKLLDMGVDGLITNNTGLMWKTVALRRHD